MSEYSSRVPSLYKIAAKYVKQAKENGSSVKRLVYSKNHPNIKGLYALVFKILRHFEQVNYLIKKAKLVESNPTTNPWLFRVLITELLWGKRKLPMVNSRAIKTVLSHVQDFEKYLRKAENKITIFEKATKPKYVRINTLKVSKEEAIQAFQDEGYTYKRHKKKGNYDNFLSLVSSLGENDFTSDFHFKELLLFSPTAQFYKHETYKNGLIILQDKASCIPVYLLNPIPGSTVLDMCAAPGIKTTLIAALLNDQGTVYAIDKDRSRFQDLNHFMEKSGVTCVKTFNKDALDVSNTDFPNVEYILVDPSCSGSGMTDRIENLNINHNRLKKLSGFQIILLKHALRNFPKAKRVVYSTCSLHPEENEEVIKEVLASTTKFKLVPSESLLNAPWVNFGSPDYGDIGRYCLYSKTDKDLTNGFFVAVFERLEDGERNPFCTIEDSIEASRNYQKTNAKNNVVTKSKMKKERKNNENRLSVTLPTFLKSNQKKKKKKKCKRKQLQRKWGGEEVVGGEVECNNDEEKGKDNGSKMRSKKRGSEELELPSAMSENYKMKKRRKCEENFNFEDDNRGSNENNKIKSENKFKKSRNQCPEIKISNGDLRNEDAKDVNEIVEVEINSQQESVAAKRKEFKNKTNKRLNISGEHFGDKKLNTFKENKHLKNKTSYSPTKNNDVNGTEATSSKNGPKKTKNKKHMSLQLAENKRISTTERGHSKKEVTEDNDFDEIEDSSIRNDKKIKKSKKEKLNGSREAREVKEVSTSEEQKYSKHENGSNEVTENNNASGMKSENKKMKKKECNVTKLSEGYENYYGVGALDFASSFKWTKRKHDSLYDDNSRDDDAVSNEFDENSQENEDNSDGGAFNVEGVDENDEINKEETSDMETGNKKKESKRKAIEVEGSSFDGNPLESLRSELLEVARAYWKKRSSLNERVREFVKNRKSKSEKDDIIST